jgi:hypothetical protein
MYLNEFRRQEMRIRYMHVAMASATSGFLLLGRRRCVIIAYKSRGKRSEKSG